MSQCYFFNIKKKTLWNYMHKLKFILLTICNLYFLMPLNSLNVKQEITQQSAISCASCLCSEFKEIWRGFFSTAFTDMCTSLWIMKNVLFALLQVWYFDSLGWCDFTNGQLWKQKCAMHAYIVTVLIYICSICVKLP